jgi:hypothetical protein
MRWRFFKRPRKIKMFRIALKDPIRHRTRMLSHCSLQSAEPIPQALHRSRGPNLVGSGGALGSGARILAEDPR